MTNIPGRSHPPSPGTPRPGAPQHHCRGARHRSPPAWAWPAPDCFPRDQRDHPRSSGPREELSPPPQVSWGRAAAHQLCAALLHETAPTFQPGHQRAERETVGSCFVLIQHPARHLSRASPVPAQSCPIPPPAQAAGMCMGSAQPAPGHLQGFEACQEFYPGICLPFSSKGFCHVCPSAGFVRQVKASSRSC